MIEDREIVFLWTNHLRLLQEQQQLPKKLYKYCFNYLQGGLFKLWTVSERSAWLSFFLTFIDFLRMVNFHLYLIFVVRQKCVKGLNFYCKRINFLLLLRTRTDRQNTDELGQKSKCSQNLCIKYNPFLPFFLRSKHQQTLKK